MDFWFRVRSWARREICYNGYEERGEMSEYSIESVRNCGVGTYGGKIITN